MGRKSKTRKQINKGKQRLAYLTDLDHTYHEFSLKLDNLAPTKWVERRLLIEEQIQMFERSKELYLAQNCLKFYWGRMSTLHSRLFSVFVQSQKYLAALELCLKFEQFPPKAINKSLIELHIDLFLLRLDKSRHYLHTEVIMKVIKILNEAGTESDIEERFISSQNAYILNCLFELSRFQMYEAVKVLTNKMLVTDLRIERNLPTERGVIFFLFSGIDELRFDILDHGANNNKLFELTREDCKAMLSCDPMQYGEVFLADAILGYYATFYEKFSSLDADVEEYCIKAMEMYITFKRNQFSDSCCTCHEVGKERLMLCQGCRSVKFCCKDCQRLNYLHQEETGTKGMGHKYLCPVFKAYQKRNKNTDDSKKDHLDRKFRRACKRFLIGTLENIGEKRAKCLVAFTTADED
ncbi:predicted protein [Chaetoceros tenuissimus]|uniref:MYND-type domain-containing protein n=1 Tax=Chaetoceros tenuissimus TaxID=426638 RepID=A0AAD3HF24_9STRA|nr:predicted protein [Chaetoceros tenuissimus]